MQIDAELIGAACQGNAGAIEEVLCRYSPAVTRFARRYCATPEDVEDAVQETLWIAARKIGTVRVAAAFVSWLFQVVRNECYRLLRFKRREIALADPGEWHSPETELLLRQDVIEALQALAPAYREVLIRRDLQGLSGPEVAGELGLTIETVKSRLHRARALMRASLAAWRE